MTDWGVIPILETERLLLRAFKPEDLEPFSEIVSDQRVLEYATYSGQVMTRSQAWNWLCMMLGHWQLRGFGIWAVEEKSSGMLIGRIGIQLLEWFEEAELVWMLAYPSWGKGYATEGASAAVRFGFSTLKLPSLAALIHTQNQRSIRLAQRLGMDLVDTVKRDGKDFLHFKLEGSTWVESHS